MQPVLREWSDKTPHNTLALAGGRGVIMSGLAGNYVREVLGHQHDYSILRVTTYPLPLEKVRALVDHCDEIFVIEEGYPVIEKRLNGPAWSPGQGHTR